MPVVESVIRVPSLVGRYWRPWASRDAKMWMNLVSCGAGVWPLRGCVWGRESPGRHGWFIAGKVAWESRAGSHVEEKGLCEQMRSVVWCFSGGVLVPPHRKFACPRPAMGALTPGGMAEGLGA